jgi:hypothetical protein
MPDFRLPFLDSSFISCGGFPLFPHYIPFISYALANGIIDNMGSYTTGLEWDGHRSFFSGHTDARKTVSLRRQKEAQDRLSFYSKARRKGVDGTGRRRWLDSFFFFSCQVAFTNIIPFLVFLSHDGKMVRRRAGQMVFFVRMGLWSGKEWPS